MRKQVLKKEKLPEEAVEKEDEPRKRGSKEEIGDVSLREELEDSERNDKKLFLLLGLGLLVIAAAGAYFLFSGRGDSSRNDDGQKPSIASLAQDGDTPEENFSPDETPDTPDDRSGNDVPSTAQNDSSSNVSDSGKTDPKNLKVKVLNGGAAAGVAGQIKALLVSKGFSQTEAGNAESSSHSGQAVYYQDQYAGDAQSIADALKEKYPGISKAPATNGEEKSAPIVVMLGQ